jgi:hypothetical protein
MNEKAISPAASVNATNDDGAVSLAQNNREKIKPYIDTLVDKIYQHIDRLAEKGFELRDDMSQKRVDEIIAFVLEDIMQHYQGEVIQDRNMFESLAYYLGCTLGYPYEMICMALRKLPLSGHFVAGFQRGQCMANSHMASLKAKVMKKEISTKLKQTLKTTPATPQQPVGAAA